MADHLYILISHTNSFNVKPIRNSWMAKVPLEAWKEKLFQILGAAGEMK